MSRRDYDAIVVGSGPNGLSAAITLQREGLSVLLIEAKSTIGGGLRTTELTLPGFKHDVCSAIHPLAADSPFFRKLPLHDFRLEFVHPQFAAAHPFDDGTAAILSHSIKETADSLLGDEKLYVELMNEVAELYPQIQQDILGPLRFPRKPLKLAQFGLKALPSALNFAKRFLGRNAKGLWAGMAAHSIQPLSNLATSAFGLVLMASAHQKGWPIAKGGSQWIANAMEKYFLHLGGTIQTDFFVRSLDELPSAHAVLFDVTPKQLLAIAGHKFSSLYKFQLEKYRYGAGVFKVDWALDGPVPFSAEAARRAGTVHLGGTIEEIATYERDIWRNKVGENPFVLFAQQSVFDSTRAPEGKHTGWAYCHVPHGFKGDMTTAIENQVERFAPGFKDRILARHVFDPGQFEDYNPNYIGGDINGGVIDIRQLFTRPVLKLSPYGASARGIYICSASTPPGGGVHGLCGYYSAKQALKDIFKIKAQEL